MKIDADDNNGPGSPLLIRHMEHAPFIRHSPAVQTISEFYVFYSFTAERGATITIALPLNRQGLARVDGGHEFKISLETLAAFGVKPYEPEREAEPITEAKSMLPVRAYHQDCRGSRKARHNAMGNAISTNCA